MAFHRLPRSRLASGIRRCSIRDMHSLPPELLTGPFLRGTARDLGITDRMLQGSRFARVHPRVWRHRDLEMTEVDQVAAAMLALPDRALLTGISRIRALGLDFGAQQPLRFVIEGDHHLALEGIFLHRTKKLPPAAGRMVTPAAAYLSYVARARVIDAIKVGDWLLHHGHMTRAELRDLALGALWRDGAHEAIWLLDHLDERSRSLKESETRAMLTFSGLDRPESNGALDVGGVILTPDLLYRKWGPLALEYEGTQHQLDRTQYVSDIDRYELYRNASIPYVQITNEKLAQPRRLVLDVHRALVARGYDGPAPSFGERWLLLFARVSTAVGPRQPVQR
ncbi:hypothetical protein GCM10027600_39780 [Nocardioides ginsengisegetis]